MHRDDYIYMSLIGDVTAGASARSRAVDSLIWRYLGDTRYALIGRMATTLQVMHPAIGAAVADPQLSVFFKEPIARVIRSAPLILGVVYDGPRAHATFVYALQEMIERLAGPLPTGEREQLYDECCRWYRMYGLSDRPMPASLAAFRAYVECVCEQELEATPAALRGKQMFGDPATIPQEYVPAWLWRLVSPLPIRFTVFMSVGLMPPVVRKKMGYAWTDADERRFRRTAAVIRRVWPLLPETLRYSPYARRGFARDDRPASPRPYTVR